VGSEGRGTSRRSPTSRGRRRPINRGGHVNAQSDARSVLPHRRRHAGGIASDLGSKPLLSLDEAAILLSIGRATIYRSVKRGDFPVPVITINGRMRIPRLAVERLLAGDVPWPAAAQPSVVAPAPGGCHRERFLEAATPASTRPT